MGKKIIINESQLKSIVKNILLENNDNPFKGKTVKLWQSPNIASNPPKDGKGLKGTYTVSNSYTDWKNQRIVIDLVSAYNKPNIQLTMKCGKSGFNFFEDKKLFNKNDIVYNEPFATELEKTYCEELLKLQQQKGGQKPDTNKEIPASDF